MVAQVAETEILTRDRVAVEDTWDLSTIYPDDAAWEAEAARLPELIAAVAAHRGHLGESSGRLERALDDAMAARLAVERLRVYATLKRDEDTADGGAAARYERSVALAIEASEVLAFVDPELLSLPEEKLAELAADATLARYAHLLDDLRRRRPHVRSIEVEEVLAQGADVARATSDAFTALDNADLDFGRVRDETGTEVALTKARHQLLMRSKDREVRRASHEAMSGAYLAHDHTLAALHGASVRKDAYFARVRRFPSAREEALFDNNIPTSVYDALIEAVRGARPVLGRDLDLRRRILGLDALKSYDLQVPLSPEPERRYGYREAVDVVLGGLAPLGERYVADLRAGFDARWVDVHETKGKRSGAYSWGVYGAPPVILMNWNGTISDVFTLAHEAGHAMHSLYADAAQPYHDAGYPIFLAEIASTVNEVLLTWHLLDETSADDRLGRFALLNRFADTFNGTVVRQTMFAEFEHRTHARAEAGEPLTLDSLNALYGELYAAYEPGVEVDDAVRITWGRVPHFYRAFYVYQYATGLSAAITLARALRDEGARAQERYLGLLAAGGSDYPLELLRRAGVDLASPEPVRTALAEYERVVAEMERLVDEGALKQA
ncbi:MAG: oligoendopeptidase F [Chloroflexota bacterium]|nr:oligoendopeptidase F [Chloroflexota bacterium]